MPPNGNLSQSGRPKKRGRPSRADKLAIDLARRVAQTVSAAAAAAKASAAKAREQVMKRGRGRPPKALKLDVGPEEDGIEEEDEKFEEPREVVRSKSRRKGAPRRAPGSTADWFQRPITPPLVKRQPRDFKHLDITATEIGKRETKRNPKFDEFVTFTPRKVESSAEETSRNPLSSEAASDFETDSNTGAERREGSQMRESSVLREGSLPLEEGRWANIERAILTGRVLGLLSLGEAEQLTPLAQQHDGLFKTAYQIVDPEYDMLGFVKVLKKLLDRRLQSNSN